MSQIKRYCVLKDEHTGPNVFKVHRGYILGNPYTHIKNKNTKAQVIVNTREIAIERYKKYFEASLKANPEFKEEFDKLVDACMKFDEVWIGCYCDLKEECHGDYIIQRLRQECTKRMIKKIMSEKTNVNS